MEAKALAALPESGGSAAAGRAQPSLRPQPSQTRGRFFQAHAPSPPNLELSAATQRPDQPNLSVRSAFRHHIDANGAVQDANCELSEAQRFGAAFALASATSPPPIPREIGTPSHHGSPATALGGGGKRRQGIVFGDSLSGESPEIADSSQLPASSPAQTQHQQSQRGQHIRTNGGARPRTRTMDAGMLTQRAAPPVSDRQRRRIGSLSSSGSQPLPSNDHQHKSPPPAAVLDTNPASHASVSTHRHPESPSLSSKAKEKKSSNKRLLKRLSSRPPSPAVPPSASVDSLSSPVATDEPGRIISLMKTLGGRMRGEIECQVDGGAWNTGFAYIDDDNGSLVGRCKLKGLRGPSFTTLVSNLRGCRVLLVEYPEFGRPCLELVAHGQQKQQLGEATILLLRPLASDEWNPWLAALLCWQQARPTGARTGNLDELPASVSPPPGTPAVSQARPSLRRQGQSTSSTDGSRSSNIIKVGTVMLWDKGQASNAREVFRRSSTRDPHLSPKASWRQVSCILHDDGEFRMLMENDISVLCVVQLSHLSRHAVQQLDHTVLDQDFCISLFPMYAPTSTQLSIFRPVYLALDNRVSFEVWFVLLRAFTVPDIYRLAGSDNDESVVVAAEAEVESGSSEETFRIEKTVAVRVTEAKVRTRSAAERDAMTPDRDVKAEQADPLVGNFFAEVHLDGEVRARTTTRTDTNNPFWREDCELVDLPSTVGELTIVLKRVVEGAGSAAQCDLDPMARNSTAGSGAAREEFVHGTVKILLDELKCGKDYEEWWQILDDRLLPVGSMLIKISHAEHVALLAKEYEPLSELLHRFSTGLTTMISAALPGQLRRLSEAFLDIFQASGSTSEWLMALVEDEIDGIGSQASIKKFRFGSRLQSAESGDFPGALISPTTAPSASHTDRELIVRDMSRSLAGEANLLFRGNTLLTQSLEFHMRRLGIEYLEEVLGDKISELNRLNPDCEVDPSRLPHVQQHHHNQHAMAADLDQRWNRLILVTTEVWRLVADSADRLPAELRLILKYIRAVAEDRYSDFLRNVTYTAVSGFLFLRFICPAILSPKLFGLLRDHPQPRAQRTLTLIAKVLQKMSNMSTFGKREEWMEPMNKFLSAQRPVFREYIDRVCGIPAEQEGVKNVPPSYSTPLTMLKRLGPMAREGFPSLPYLIDHARSFAGLVKLWFDSCPLDIKRGQVFDDGELLLCFNELCNGLQKRADNCLVKAQRVRATEAATRGAEHLAESLEQAALIESLSSPSGSTLLMYPEKAASGTQNDEHGDGQHLSREQRSGKDGKDGNGVEGGRAGGHRQANGTAGNTIKGRNVKVGRTILNGILRRGGKAESGREAAKVTRREERLSGRTS